MADPNVVPGQTGQPPKDVKGPSFNTMEWVHTTSPKVDYAEGNPGQETSPLQNKVWGNDSQKPAFLTTSNEKNGGRGMANGGGVG